MAVSQYQPQNVSTYMGLVADTKPAAAIGSKFIETDTKDVYLMMNTGSWVKVGTLTAGTAANVAVFV